MDKHARKEKIMNEYDFYCIICNKPLPSDEHSYCKECEKKGEYKALYEDVMKIDPEIRFSTICYMNAQITHSRHRYGVKNVLTPDESKRSLEEAVNMWKLRNTLASKIGKVKYVLAVYKKIKRITMPLDDNRLLYVTAEVKADHAKIIDEILNLKARMNNLPATNVIVN